MTGLRTTVAALAASGVLEHGNNRALVAEAAGLPVQAREYAGSYLRKHDGTPPDLWPLLLAVLGEPRRVPRLEGEDALQAESTFRLDTLLRLRRLPFVAVMVRNDIVQRRAPKHLLERDPGLVRWDQRERREAAREADRARAMGARKGFPDWLVLNAGPCPTERFGVFEFKTRGGSLEPEQRRWRDLCRAAGWHWALAREPHHVEDVLAAFPAWGWLG